MFHIHDPEIGLVLDLHSIPQPLRLSDLFLNEHDPFTATAVHC